MTVIQPTKPSKGARSKDTTVEREEGRQPGGMGGPLSIENTRRVDHSWVQLTRSPANEYVPQAGDEVCYFWNGHAVYCQQNPDLRLANGPETKDLRDRKPPWELSKVAIARLGGTSGRLPDVIRCRSSRSDTSSADRGRLCASADAKRPSGCCYDLRLRARTRALSALFHPCEDISDGSCRRRVFCGAARDWRPGDRCYVRFSDEGYHCGNVTHIQTTPQGTPRGRV